MNKQESQNQVSIIINGVKYDAVEGKGCTDCDLIEYCLSNYDPCNIFPNEMMFSKIFKKSDKKFEL